jgi:hypothetical protein
MIFPNQRAAVLRPDGEDITSVSMQLRREQDEEPHDEL